LNKGALATQFGGGVDTRTDSKQVPTTKLLDVQNGVFTKLFTISKRSGYRALSTEIQDGGGLVANARGLAERDGEVLVFTDKRCYSYRPSDDTWADTGEVAATTCTTRPIARSGSAQTQPDIAERLGVRVVAWEDSRGGVWCTVEEAATGRQLLAQLQLDAAALARNPRCVAAGDNLAVLWTREDLGTIQIALISPQHPASAPAVSILTADLNVALPFYDACPAVNGPAGVFDTRPALIAWVTAGGGFRVGYIVGAGVLGTPLYGVPSTANFPAAIVAGPIAIAWEPIGVIAGVVWPGAATTITMTMLAGATLAPVRTNTLASIGANASRIAVTFGGAGSDGHAVLYWAAEVTAARSDLTTVTSGAALQTATTLDAAFTTLRGHGLVSRAWHDGATVDGSKVDGDAYVMVAHTVRFFPYVAALRLSDDSGINSPSNTIVARLMPGEAAGSNMRTTGAGTRAWTQHLPSVTPIGQADTEVYSRSHAVCLPYRIQLSSQNGDQFSEQGLKLATLNMRPAYPTAQLGRGLYLGSAAPQMYDGEQWREADFHCAPDLGYDTAGAPVALASVVTIDGAGSIVNGTYVYAFWYEVPDAQGELHRGAVSAKIDVVMSGGPKSFTMTIPTCRLTRFANARICVARSEQGATGTDTTLELFRVTSNDPSVTTGANRFVLNDVTVDAVTFTDSLDDATVKTREPLYTNGGILSNNPSPWAGGVIAAAKGRLFWTDPTDPNMVRHSQQRADDTALEAPIDLSLVKDSIGGDIAAIGPMDDTVIVFGQTAVFIFGGPGPLADPSVDPSANAFTAIELVTTDVGCVSAPSVGASPVGLVFKSQKGIMLLARTRQIVNIGNDVQKYDGQNVVRTTLITTSQRVICLTDSGRTLMWDYNRNAWATWTNHEGLDALVLDGLYYYLRTDSRVFVETPGIYKDDELHIQLKIETAWIHFASYLQGWQRVLYAYFLGRFISKHTLTVRWRLDYNDAYSPEIQSNVNADYNPSLYGVGLYGVGDYGGPGGGTTRYQRRIHINKRSQAISFLIGDLEADGDFGASFELSELLLIGGGIGTDFKVGAARQA
jgi:hypothetical protein